ncbi:MAG TPA: hypothetical protein VIM11_26635 [Tepidisphaeraceae bacterium]|jgi:hypothetical protein
MTDEVHPTNKFCIEAIDRIARTADGAALYVFLQRRLMSISVAPTDGALRSDEGERTFAAKLISVMAKGIFESGGRSGITGSSIGPGGSEQPVVVPSPRAVRVSGEPGSTRRIGPHTRVAGYDFPDIDEQT